VLDVGCGSGLLLNAAAKRLTDGSAVGVDVWHASDLGGNQRETTLRNAALEGVAERVEVHTGDGRRLPFADAAFDVVVSLNVVHNMGKRADRAKALTEIARVLKPGGTVVLADFRNVGEYVTGLRASGMPGSRRELVGWVLFYPVFAAVGTRGAG
jgi:ubiquinone/menaquinone biosynthesis C-methylase UbiE